MSGHLLRDFQPAAVLQIVRDAGRSKAMATNLGPNTGLPATPPDHLMHIGLVQGRGLQLFLAPGAEQRKAALSCQAGGGEVLLQVLL